MRSHAVSEAEAVEVKIEAANAVAGVCRDDHAQVCAKLPHDLGPAWPCLARSLRGYGHNRDSAWPAPHAQARASSAVAHSSNDYSSALAAPTSTQRAGIVVSATAAATTQLLQAVAPYRRVSAIG